MLHKFTALALRLGILVPIFYFGIQLIAAPFYPGYSFLRQDASTLGSDGSTFPALFNTGALLMGAITLIAAAGVLRALLQFRTHPILAWLMAIALVSCGLASINAGLFPLPDARHNPGVMGVGMFLLPVLFPVALWKLKESRGLKRYLIVNLLMFLALIPVMSGVTGIDTQSYQGLLQRIAALVVFVPIGVTAFVLFKQSQELWNSSQH